MVDSKEEKMVEEKNGEIIEVKNEEEKEKMEEKTVDAVVIEEEKEEEIVDAENTWGNEDPSEIEVEAFCLPPTLAILEDVCEHVKRRRLCVFPLQITDFSHPAIIEAIDKSLDFKTSYVKVYKDDGSETWNGIIEMTFKTGYMATDAAEFLKTIREDIQVKIVSENTKKLSEHWIADSDVELPRSVGHLLCVKRIVEQITTMQLKKIFSTASEIVITRPHIGSRIGYVFFDTQQQMLEAFEKHSKEDVIINNNKLKIMKHQHPQLPSGLLKMKRRYKVLLQIHELEKALKDKEGKLTDTTRTKINTTIESCNMTIDKDDKVREGLGLKLWTFKELRSIKPLRESDVIDSIWLPNKTSECAEDDEYERLKRMGSKTGVPSLLEMPMTHGPPFPPMARVQEIAAQLANIQRGPANQSRGGGNNRNWSNNRNQSRDNQSRDNQSRDSYQNRQNNKRGRSPPKDEPGAKMNRDDKKPENKWTPKNNSRNQHSNYNNKSNYNQQQQQSQQQGGNYNNQSYNPAASNLVYQQTAYQAQTGYNTASAQQQQSGYDATAYMQPQAYGYDYSAYNQQAAYGYNYAQQPAATAATGAAYAGIDQTQQHAAAAAAWTAAQQQNWSQNQWAATSDPTQAAATATDHSAAGANYGAYNWTPATNWSTPAK